MRIGHLLCYGCWSDTAAADAAVADADAYDGDADAAADDGDDAAADGVMPMLSFCVLCFLINFDNTV